MADDELEYQITILVKGAKDITDAKRLMGEALADTRFPTTEPKDDELVMQGPQASGLGQGSYLMTVQLHRSSKE